MLGWLSGEAEGFQAVPESIPALCVRGRKCHAYMTSHFWHSHVGTCHVPAVGWRVMATVSSLVIWGSSFGRRKGWLQHIYDMGLIGEGTRLEVELLT